MSHHIGDLIPPPLRFDLGKPAVPGETAQAVVLATVDAGGAPRIAVLAASEVEVPGDRTLRLRLRSESASCANLVTRPAGSIWCVLDGAAYTLQVAAATASEIDDGERAFELTVTGVWCDFRPDAPMIAGPTYRPQQTD